MYHYTYLLQHKTQNMRYIGVRSSNCSPTADNAYWGSSKHIPYDVKDTHSKIILKVFDTRDEAVEHEMLLHRQNDVVVNKNYYNKSLQTSIAFDTTGTTLTEEHKRKCSIALTGKKHTQETKDLISKKLLGKKRSAKSRENIRQAQLRTPLNKGVNNSRFKPWYLSNGIVTHLFYNITKHKKAIEDGYHFKQYVSIQRQTKKYGKPIQKGVFKNCIVGEIPTTTKDIV